MGLARLSLGDPQLRRPFWDPKVIPVGISAEVSGGQGAKVTPKCILCTIHDLRCRCLLRSRGIAREAGHTPWIASTSVCYQSLYADEEWRFQLTMLPNSYTKAK